jgi:hypothetical protein
VALAIVAAAEAGEPAAGPTAVPSQEKNQGQLSEALAAALAEAAAPARVSSLPQPDALALAAPPGDQGKTPSTSSTPREHSHLELAQKTQNPVSNLISLSFEIDTNLGYEPNGRNHVLSMEPVFPLSLSKEWSLVTQTTVPVIYEPFLDQSSGGKGGLGDTTFIAYFTPAKAVKFLWGAGPIFLFPTASDSLLGTGKWGAGPAAAAVVVSGPWVAGILANNIWSFAGDSNRPAVNRFQLEYGINYNLPHGWYLGYTPTVSADWTAPSGNKWTVPFGGGFGKVFHLGKQPLNVSIAVFGNPIRPDTAGAWTVCFSLGLLFPK